MSDSTTVLKIAYGDDIRRVPIVLVPNYESLRTHVANLYSLAEDSFVLKYLDEEKDKVTIANHDDYLMALKEKAAILRVFVVDRPVRERAEKIAREQFGQAQNEFDRFAAQLPSHLAQLKPFFATIERAVTDAGVKAQSAATDAAAHAAHAVHEATQASKPAVHRHVVCDSCNAHPIVGKRYKCQACADYDLCESCYARRSRGQPVHDANHLFLEIEKPSHLRQAAGSGCPFRGSWRRNAAGPKARFVAHLSVFDGTEVHPGDQFVKMWRVRNEGSVAWPEGTVLQIVGGDQLSTDKCARVGATSPGEEVDIAVDMVAPSLAGRYVSYYRLVAPSGKKFGQRLWCDVIVADPQQQQQQQQQATPSESSDDVTVAAAPAPAPAPARASPSSFEDWELVSQLTTSQQPAPLVPEPAIVAPAKPEPTQPVLPEPTIIESVAAPVAPQPEPSAPEPEPEPLAQSKVPSEYELVLKQLAQMGFDNTDKNLALLIELEGNVVAVVHELLRSA